jgi:glutamyl-tRNA synthetase
MTREEIIEAFSLADINPANAVFDPQKLLWLNGEYIRQMSDQELAELAAPLLVAKGLTTMSHLKTRWQWFLQVIGLLKERCKVLTEFADIGYYFFVGDFSFAERGVKKHFRPESTAAKLMMLAERFEQLDSFNEETSENALYLLAKELAVKPAALIHPTRLAVSGLTGGPSLFQLLAAVGKEQVISRMKKAVGFIEQMGGNDA